jgi:hypothetical protein
MDTGRPRSDISHVRPQLPASHIRALACIVPARVGVESDWGAVARRAGHGVAVLLKIYAHCIDGRADAANRRITDALNTSDTQTEPVDDEGDHSEPAAGNGQARSGAGRR